MSEVDTWLKSLPAGLGPGKMEQSIRMPWISYTEFVKIPSPRQYRCILAIPVTLHNSSLLFLAEKQILESEIKETTGTLSEVQ